MIFDKRPPPESHNSFGGAEYPCKCGHYWHDHQLTWWKIWNGLMGKCEICMCNNYKSDKDWNVTR